MDFQIAEHSVIVASEQQVSADLSGEAVILCLDSGIYYGLDAVGARIWSLIQEPRTVKDVQDVLLDEYEVEPEECRRDSLALLQSLAAEGLVEVKVEGPA